MKSILIATILLLMSGSSALAFSGHTEWKEWKSSDWSACERNDVLVREVKPTVEPVCGVTVAGSQSRKVEYKCDWVSGWGFNQCRLGDKKKETEVRSCDIELPACEGTCPDYCTFEGGTVPDGLGGEKVCPSTVRACPVHSQPQLAPKGTGEAQAPTCGSIAPVELPANPHFLRVGPLATISWNPTAGNRVNVLYKAPESSSWEHSLRDWPNIGIAPIGFLREDKWVFSIQQGQDCGWGPLVPVREVK